MKKVHVVLSLGLVVALAATLFALLGAAPAANAAKHRVVFQITSDGAEPWDAVLGNVENLREALGPQDTRVLVVGHGKGLGMRLADDEKRQARMRKLHEGGVVFAACENTMRKKNVTRGELVPFATTVDSGVAEVVRKQEEGWSYIKNGL
jgi:uncharacterized protein